MARFNIAKWNREHRFKKSKRKRAAPKPMARRRTRTVTRFVRRGASRARGLLGGGGLKAWFKSGAAGVGGGTIGQQIEAMVGNPTNGMLGKYGGAYLAGGMKGVVGMLILDTLTGSGGLVNLFRGFGGGQQSGGDSL